MSATVGFMDFGTKLPTALYRLYDKDGAPLYIGATDNLKVRLAAHSRRHWWPQVHRTRVDWFASREDAFEAEDEAIKAENPSFNIAGTVQPAISHKPPIRRPSEMRPDGDAIRELRFERRLTLLDAGVLIGCHPKTIEAIERGRLGASEVMIRKIAKAFGVEPDEIRKKAAA